MLTSPIPGTYWTWRGQQVYYLKAGQNSDLPPLLLVHGFGASTDHWRKNIAFLSQTYEVWAIDLLGFGRSAKPNLTYSGDLWRSQLHDFISTEIGRPTVLAGNSLGGYAALCVAASYVEAVAGVILLNSAGPFTDTSPLGATKQNPFQKSIQNFAQILFRQPWGSRLLFEFVRQKSQIRKTLRQVYVNQAEVTEQLVEEIYRPSSDRGAAEVFASIFSTPQGEKVDQLLSKIQCPLLCVWGDRDPWMNSQKRSAKFREHYSRLTEVFINAGHCPHDDAPAEVNAAISNWLGNLPNSIPSQK